MPAASPDLRKELNGAEEDGPEHDARIFGEVTDLFLSNVGRLGDSQIAAVDGVLAHLVERVEAATVIQLSEALSTIDRAPGQTVRKLAFHEQPQVAAPVLRHSSCLSDADLLEIVKSRGQQHLLAICDRKALNEALTDALMRFGDVNVSNALARNTGARFSECGYATLVGRAERDEGLAEKLGVRMDIPGSLLRELIGKVADVVRARFLTAPRPVARQKAQNAAAAGGNGAARKAIDYTQAQNEVVALNRTVAVANVHGPAAGIDAVEAIENGEQLRSYYLLYAVLGEFEKQLNHFQAAIDNFRKALELTELTSEQSFLSERLRDSEERSLRIVA